eukprot:COSAG02_NODE_1404_length_12808_cov_64.813282_2_plen_148_part_00
MPISSIRSLGKAERLPPEWMKGVGNAHVANTKRSLAQCNARLVALVCWLFGHRATPQVGVELINVSQFFFPSFFHQITGTVFILAYMEIFDPGSWATELVHVLRPRSSHDPRALGSSIECVLRAPGPKSRSESSSGVRDKNRGAFET